MDELITLHFYPEVFRSFWTSHGVALSGYEQANIIDIHYGDGT